MGIGDTGATYSEISSGIFHFSFGDRSIQVSGILGQPSSCPFSSMVPIQIGPMTKENPFLLSLDPPVNPLERDMPWK